MKPTATYMASAFIPPAVAGLAYGLVKCLRDRARSNLSDNAPDLEAPALVNRGHSGLSFHINGYRPTTVTINNVTYVQAGCVIENPAVSCPILSATASTPKNYQTFPQAAIA